MPLRGRRFYGHLFDKKLVRFLETPEFFHGPGALSSDDALYDSAGPSFHLIKESNAATHVCSHTDTYFTIYKLTFLSYNIYQYYCKV